MAMESGNTAGSLSASTSDGEATIACPAGSTIYVRNSADSAATARISLSGNHTDGDFAYLEAGETRAYRTSESNPTLAYKTDASTATLYVDVARNF